MASLDPREKSTRRLHQAYTAGKLRLLVGNGISIGAGLPSWDALNVRVLESLIDSDATNNNQWANLFSGALGNLTDKLYGVLGRDGAADFVRMANARDFVDRVKSALFGDRGIDDLTLTATHYQIAAMAARAAILTTNFDPLLELALAALTPTRRRWKAYRLAKPGRAFRPSRVEHLHGWLDPDGSSGGNLVLTESDYFDLAKNDAAPANRRLRSLFTEPGVTLILGMSMYDVNIRRLLYVLRSKEQPKGPPVFVVLLKNDPQLDNYTRDYWAKRYVSLIFVGNYSEIPGLLRDVQWGPTLEGRVPAWLAAAILWREQRIPESLLFDDDWQFAASKVLKTLRTRIRTMYAVPLEERIQIALFLPLRHKPHQAPRLSVVASSREIRSGKAARTFSHQRSFAIAKGQEQGVAGSAFVDGTIRESLFGDRTQDQNLTDEMVKLWVGSGGYRDWRSVLAYPLRASPDSLPIGVLTMTSNLAEPFWARFGDRDPVFKDELTDAIMTSIQWVLEATGDLIY